MENLKKSVTQNDVAKEAGVTRSMVSYVISGSNERSVAPETRRRILRAIEKLGYRPNKAAQALQQGNGAFAKKQIGLILCNADVFRRPYYAEIIQGIHTAAHKNKFHIRFIRFFEELKNPVLFNELIHHEEIGGLILISTDLCIKSPEDQEIIENIKERIKKIVCVEWKSPDLSCITFDRQDTARKAADYLFCKGYQTISYIGQSDDRIMGVKQAFIEHKKDPQILSTKPAVTMSEGYNAVKELDKESKLTRAIVCGSDEVAIGVLCYLNEEKIAIPNQVAIISIDNIETSGYTNPPLTTMNVQKAAMGAKAVEMIVNGTADQSNGALCVSLPTNIVIRKSC